MILFFTTRPARHAPITALASMLFILQATLLPARDVRAILIPGAGKASETAYLVGASASIKLELPQRNLSPPQELPEGDLMMAALEALPADLTEIPQGTPMVKVPAAWEHCIMVFLPDPANKVFPYQVFPLNISGASLPKGKTLVCNFSHTVLRLRFDKAMGVVTPGKTATVEAPRRDFGPFPVMIECMVKGEVKPRVICSTMWQHDPEARQILFAIPVEGNMVPRIWGVLDQQDPEAKPDPP